MLPRFGLAGGRKYLFRTWAQSYVLHILVVLPGVRPITPLILVPEAARQSQVAPLRRGAEALRRAGEARRHHERGRRAGAWPSGGGLPQLAFAFCGHFSHRMRAPDVLSSFRVVTKAGSFAMRSLSSTLFLEVIAAGHWTFATAFRNLLLCV